jgi:cell division protein ZapA (FtsZ GTPase activity inhibitor)
VPSDRVLRVAADAGEEAVLAQAAMAMRQRLKQIKAA